MKFPLILSFSPRGEGTLELSAAAVLASSLPLGRETECGGLLLKHSTGFGMILHRLSEKAPSLPGRLHHLLPPFPQEQRTDREGDARDNDWIP